MAEQEVENDFWEKPHQLIFFDEDGKVAVKEDVLEAISKIKSKTCMAGIIGGYREGKSYFMNRLLGQKKGFEVGGDLNSQTKGIWIQAKKHPTCPGQTLLALDTQGLFDVDNVDSSTDLKVFSMTQLLCNCLIYNLLGKIDKGMLELLNLTSQVVDKIKSTGDDSKHKSIPLVVVLRDVTLSMKIHGKPVSPDEYLEGTICLKPDSKQNESYNKDRKSIAKHFSPRQCFALPFPAKSPELLDSQDLEDLPDTDLAEKFVLGCNNAIKAILSSAQKHIKETVEFDGREFSVLVREYVQSINDGKVPIVGTMVEQIRKSSCSDAKASALLAYSKMMDSVVFPVEEEDLNSIHLKSAEEALSIFKKEAYFDDESEYEKDLQDALEQSKKESERLNCDTSSAFCQELLTTCFKSLKIKIKEDIYMKEPIELQQFLRDKLEAIDIYRQTPGRGPMAENILDEYLLSLKDSEILLRKAKMDEEKRKEEKAKREFKNRFKGAAASGAVTGLAAAGGVAKYGAPAPVAITVGAIAGVIIAVGTFVYDFF